MDLEKELTHIKKREIQAPIVKILLEGFIEHFGQDKILPILNKIIEEDAINSGLELANIVGGNSMKDLTRIVRDIWAKDDAMKIEYIEENDDILSFNVVKCRYVEAYEKNNMKELGVFLSCNRDKPFTTGFNPNFELKRTQTIMEGAKICDFRFIKKKE
ncbi:MAG: hypothetical protein FK731_01615 [Asgard group archaeon]|nr:hypothetical protein [Asgard group archaeon]